MAVAYVASIAGTEAASSTTATVDLSSCSAGQLALVLISRYNPITDPNTVPSGWSLVSTHSASGYVNVAWLYAKVLTSGDLGSITWGWEASTKTLIDAHIYSGADQSSPIATSAKGTTETSGGRPLDFGSVTSNEAMLVVLGSCYATSTRTFGNISGYTERYDHGHTYPDTWHLCADTAGGWEGGASNPSCSISNDASARYGFHVAIRAASAAAARIFVPDLQGGLESNLTGGI